MPLPRGLSAAVSAAIALTAIAVAVPPASFASATGPAAGLPTKQVEYRLPFAAGQSYRVTQGWHGSFSHFGLSAFAYDFALPEGTPVVAAAAGIVAFVEDGNHACGGAALRDRANLVTLYHADGTATTYVHLSAVSVRVGDVVASGQEIGLSGKVGFTGCQAHLHFARQAQGKAVTQSEPIYFAEFGRRQIPTGAVVTSANPVCSQATLALPDQAFCAIYTTPGDLGDVAEVRLERTIRIGSPPSSGSRPAPRPSAVSPDSAVSALSASWLGRFTFTDSGTYTFTATADRDVRVSIDGRVVIDGWADTAGAGQYVVSEWMPAGQHVILVEYRSGPSPLLRFGWHETEPVLQVRTAY